MPLNFSYVAKKDSVGGKGAAMPKKSVAHSGEWRDCRDGKRRYYCALPDSPSKDDGVNCRHAGGIVQDSHWSCCGSLKKDSLLCQDTMKHDYNNGVCMICVKCSYCTGFGSRCCRVSGRDRSSDKGSACGCGSGDAGCRLCGMCKSCGGKETCPGSKSASGKWERQKSEKKSDTARILPGIHVVVDCKQPANGDEGNAAGDNDAKKTLRAGIVAIAYKDKTFDVLFDDEGYELRVPESRVRLHEKSIEYVNYSKGIIMDRKAVASIARDQLTYLRIVDEVGEDTLYVPPTSSSSSTDCQAPQDDEADDEDGSQGVKNKKGRRSRSEHSARSSRLSPSSRSQSVDDEGSEDIWEDVKSEAEIASSSNEADAAADTTKRPRRRRSQRMSRGGSSSRRHERRRSSRINDSPRLDGSEPDERSREVNDDGDNDKKDDQVSQDSDDYSEDDREEGQEEEDREESSDDGDDGMDSDDDDYAEHDSDEEEEEEEEEEHHRGRSRNTANVAKNNNTKSDAARGATVDDNDEIEEEEDVKVNLAFGHGGIMKCACGMQLGDLYFPLHVGFKHCDRRCRWTCCGGMWSDSLCSNSAESAALIEEREAKRQAEAKAARDNEKPYDLLTPKELVDYLIHQVPDDGRIKSD